MPVHFLGANFDITNMKQIIKKYLSVFNFLLLHLEQKLDLSKVATLGIAKLIPIAAV